MRDGQRVAVVGGGPAGCGCAITLAREARRLHRRIEVVLYEPRDFPREGNVCVGVLSPPFWHLLKELGLTLPPALVQRYVRRYVLHTDGERLDLPNPAGAEPTLTLDRGELDRFLIEGARQVGVRVRAETVVDFRLTPDAVFAYSRDGTEETFDALVCAFGLGSQLVPAFANATGYLRPPLTRSLLTNFRLEREVVERLVDSDIHALLPASQPRIEFAALTPKDDYVTVNVAGPQIAEADLEFAIGRFQTLGLLPANLPAWSHQHNAFPSGPARHFFGDRLVAVGNASGLLRPLKGKGINAGLLTGRRAAKTMMHEGISKQAFITYYEACNDITTDYRYGRILRSLYRLSRSLGYLDPVVGMARHDPTLYQMFHALVSGEGSYRGVVLGLLRPLLWARMGVTLAGYEYGRRLGRA
ncbi:MAG: NAD(P)/FAD-dependent oxidoreductase [Chloroflexota bacterium]